MKSKIYKFSRICLYKNTEKAYWKEFHHSLKRFCVIKDPKIKLSTPPSISPVQEELKQKFFRTIETIVEKAVQPKSTEYICANCQRLYSNDNMIPVRKTKNHKQTLKSMSTNVIVTIRVIHFWLCIRCYNKRLN